MGLPQAGGMTEDTQGHPCVKATESGLAIQPSVRFGLTAILPVIINRAVASPAIPI